MSYSTGPLPVATTDSYADDHAVVLHCHGANSLLVSITNAAAVVQIAQGGSRPDSADLWDVEWYAPPGAYPLDAGDGPTIDGIQLRSAVKGTPAHVSIVAFV